MATKERIAQLLIDIGLDSDKASKEAEKLDKQLNKAAKSGEKLDKSTKKAEKSLERFKSVAGGVNRAVNALVIGATAVAGAIGFIGKNVISTSASFETLRARLKTVTGSVEAANGAFAFIKEFAQKTPFEVDELTDAYVRMVSAGIVPTTESLTQLGDMAAASGKSFAQWVEAIKDAQQGEFERLKEFMINFRRDGDKVKFTFRGITTEVEGNDKAIGKYLIGLGDLRGIAGGMADRMETFSGKTSNLKDAWDAFLDGVAQMGPLDEAKALLADLMKQIGGTGGLAPLLARVLTDAIRTFRRIAQSDLTGTLESALNAVRFIIDNFSIMVGLFAAAKTLSAFSAVAAGMQSIGLATSAALGPIGLITAALIALIPIAIKAGEKIGDALANDGSNRSATGRGVFGRATGIQKYNPAVAHQLQFAASEVRSAEDVVKAAESGTSRASRSAAQRKAVSDAHRNLERAKRRYASLETMAFEAMQRAKAEEESTANAAALAASNAELSGRAAQVLPTRSGAGAKKKKKKSKFVPTSVAELFQGAARGDIGNIADRTPDAKDITPTVAVTINNYNFRFQDTFKITGTGDPMETGRSVVTQIKAEFDRRLSIAGQQLQTSKVR